MFEGFMRDYLKNRGYAVIKRRNDPNRLLSTLTGAALGGTIGYIYKPGALDRIIRDAAAMMPTIAPSVLEILKTAPGATELTEPPDEPRKPATYSQQVKVKDMGGIGATLSFFEDGRLEHIAVLHEDELQDLIQQIQNRIPETEPEDDQAEPNDAPPPPEADIPAA